MWHFVYKNNGRWRWKRPLCSLNPPCWKHSIDSSSSIKLLVSMMLARRPRRKCISAVLSVEKDALTIKLPHEILDALSWRKVQTCRLVQLNKYLAGPVHAHIVFSLLMLWSGLAYVRWIQHSDNKLPFVLEGVEWLSRVQGSGGGIWQCEIYFLLHFHCLLWDLKSLVTEQSAWAVTELVQTQEKSNDCSLELPASVQVQESGAPE